MKILLEYYGKFMKMVGCQILTNKEDLMAVECLEMCPLDGVYYFFVYYNAILQGHLVGNYQNS